MRVIKAPQLEYDGYTQIKNRSWAIFVISVLSLYLEMLFIRWIGTEIRIFAYLQNTILIASFLGLGLGCFTSRKPISIRQSLMPLFFLMTVLAIPFIKKYFTLTSSFLSVLEDFVIWNNTLSSSVGVTILLVLGGLILTYFLLILVVDVFVPLGRLLGRLMDDHTDTIWAYSLNIGGSLVGTWLFTTLSALYQPPFTWFLAAGIFFVVFIFWTRHGWRLNLVFLISVIFLSILASFEKDAFKVIWSPYQKLAVLNTSNSIENSDEYVITVNNTGYQWMLNLSTAKISLDPESYPSEMRGLSQYDIPLLLHPQPMKYLIVGAGSGNDAAGGLRQSVPEITAVEIDPAIISLGRTLHPELPYSSKAVKVVVNDARSYFSTTHEKFDVISFGLLDSHTTTSMTNARLDHYVYTQESILQAKSLLAPGGILVLTFEAQKPFISDRMALTLKEVFGEDPIVFRIPNTSYGWGGVMFITGDISAVKDQIAKNQRLNDLITKWQREYPIELSQSTMITTDDWPYIYLESPRIPVLYYLLVGLMILIFARSYKKWEASGLMQNWKRSHWHFFFLGAAFLLLEVQNISKASVVLGNTWQVNSVIVSGVLIMALLANLLARKFPRLPIMLVYTLLIVTCLSLYFIDLASFAFLPYAIKSIVVGCLTSLPMLFSGIIFIRSFEQIEEKNTALGANLGGALVGALLQSITFVIGIKALLLIVALLYLLSLLCMPYLKFNRRTAK